MSKCNEYRVSQVFDSSLIPEGYVRNSKSQERGNLFSNYVIKQIRSGKVLAILHGGNPDTGNGHGGCFYVHPDHMSRLQNEWDSRQETAAASDRSFSESNPLDSISYEVAITLGRIEQILERLAVAAETIATQPAEQAGSWRHMNGEAL